VGEFATSNRTITQVTYYNIKMRVWYAYRVRSSDASGIQVEQCSVQGCWSEAPVGRSGWNSSRVVDITVRCWCATDRESTAATLLTYKSAYGVLVCVREHHFLLRWYWKMTDIRFQPTNCCLLLMMGRNICLTHLPN